MTGITNYWVDDCGNMWNKVLFSRDEAIKRSKTMHDCIGCVDCHDCIHCDYCVSCRNCVACNHCSATYDCEGCRHCTACIGCKKLCYCRKCKASAACTYCSDLTDCARCIECSRLTGVKYEPDKVTITTPTHKRITLYDTPDNLTGCIDDICFNFNNTSMLKDISSDNSDTRSFKRALATMIAMKYSSDTDVKRVCLLYEYGGYDDYTAKVAK